MNWDELPNLMETMHLYYKVLSNLDISTRKENRLFPLAPLTNSYPQLEQVQWRSCPIRMLEKYLPSLHMTLTIIQVLFNDVFQVKSNTSINLGKDFISFCVPNVEIIAMFSKAKLDYMIDVLVRATIDIHATLAYVEDNDMNFLVIICAQTVGIQ